MVKEQNHLRGTFVFFFAKKKTKSIYFRYVVSSAVWVARIALKIPPIERYDFSASKLYPEKKFNSKNFMKNLETMQKILMTKIK